MFRLSRRTRPLLAIAGGGLIPIGLSWALLPEGILPAFYGMDVPDPDLFPILRALSGVYLGMGLFFLRESFRPRRSITALRVLGAFMVGAAAGRVLNWILDGTPSPVYLVYLGLEVILALWAINCFMWERR